MHPSFTRLPTLFRLTISAVLVTNLVWLVFLSHAAAESSAAAEAGAPVPNTEQTIAASPDAAPPVMCEYGCEDHREGTEICINKKQHRCSKQGWQPTGITCANPPPVAK